MLEALSISAPWGAFFCALTAAALAAYLYAEHTGRRVVQWIAKPLASTGFIGVALLLDPLSNVYGRWVMLALGLSMVGDICLISKEKLPFLAGLSSFLLGHVAFAVAFVLLGVDWVMVGVSVGLMGAVGVGVYRWLRPGVPEPMRPPVVAYVVIICAMVAAAMGAWSAGAPLAIPVAASMFWLSDISVARARFKDAPFSNRLWGLPLYYAAQLVFALTIFEVAISR